MTDIIDGPSRAVGHDAAPALVAPELVAPALVAPALVAPALVAPPTFDQPALARPRPVARRKPVSQRSEHQAAVNRAAYQALVAMATAPPSAPSLRTRLPAFAVMKQCLRVQSAAAERSTLARLFGREPLHPDARSWYRGALGELEIANILDRLDRRWTVLHAVPVGAAGADIDHVVIGPGGTFTINTKNHSGKKIWTAGTTFMVDGQKLAHIHHSTFEAKRAARLLSDVTGTPVAVTPLIVVVRPASLIRKKPDVTVMESTDLFRWLRRQPQMQTDATVARISWAAERRETWTTLVDDMGSSESGQHGTSGQGGTPGHTATSVHTDSTDAADIDRRFAELRAEVETAYSRRQAWSLLGAVAFLAAVTGCAMLIAPAVPAIVTELVGG